MKNNKVYIINQTHWDREWYESFESFRFRLTETLDKVLELLDRGDMEVFLLDGQSVVLEDYREADEDKYNKLAEYIRQGRVIVGPWYVLPDEFLVNGESVIRNLEAGMQECEKISDYQRVGYLPDTFGHIGQLPQILKLHGIDNAILFRGVKSNKAQIYWQAPDGSRIKLIYPPKGYYFEGLLVDNYVEMFKQYLESIDEYYEDGIFLLAGGDHLEPPIDYKERLEIIEKQLGIEIIQISPEEYIKNQGYDENIILNGELRDNSTRLQYILPGVLSTRTYLKQDNQRLEDSLLNYVEPLSSILSENGGEYKYNYINRIWKELIKNHPHDSICGCGIDEIHREMEGRSRKIEEMQRSSLRYVRDKLFTRSKTDLNPYLHVFNPLEKSFSGTVEAEIVLPESFRGSVELYDEEKKLEVDVLEVRNERQFESDNLSAPNFFDRKVFKAVFYLENIPALGFKTLKVKEGTTESLASVDSFIENEYYRIYPETDGTIKVVNKKNNEVLKGLNAFVHSMDCGDEYNYSPPEVDLISKAKLIDYEAVKGKNFSRLILKLSLKAPAELHESRKTFSSEKKELIITSEVVLEKASNTVRFNTRLNNNLKDMRLRVLMPIGEEIESFYTDTAFDLVKRKKAYEENVTVEPLQEAPITTFPSLSTAVLEGVDKILIASHIGLQEFMISKTEEGDAASLTLIRAVGWLSRGDYKTRGGQAGPQKETPEAQCERSFEFQYAVTFAEKEDLYSSISISKAFRAKPYLFQGNSKIDIASLGELKAKNSILSSIRKTKDGKILATIYNPGENEEEIKFRGCCEDIKAKEIKKLQL